MAHETSLVMQAISMHAEMLEVRRVCSSCDSALLILAVKNASSSGYKDRLRLNTS